MDVVYALRDEVQELKQVMLDVCWVTHDTVFMKF